MHPLPNRSATVFALFFAAFAGLAHAGVAVVIDRDDLKLVARGSDGCASDRVIFVTVDGRVRAVCDVPPAPEPKPEGGGVALIGVSPAPEPLPPPPPPTWSVDQGANLRDVLATWLPAGWTLAWDTPTVAVAAAPFSYQGEAMVAVAELFDRRSVWADTRLIACAFPTQQILQVRDSGQCGVP